MIVYALFVSQMITMIWHLKQLFQFSQSDQSMCIIGLGCLQRYIRLFHRALHHAVSNDDLYIMCIFDCVPVSVSSELFYRDGHLIITARIDIPRLISVLHKISTGSK